MTPLSKCGLTALSCLCALAGLGAPLRAEVKTLVDHNDNNHASPAFRFEHLPPPAGENAATHAKFTIIQGKPDENASDLARLHDGILPTWEDQPYRNFAFATGPGGRIHVDLGRLVDIAQVNTYSWHPDTRGPQVYSLYAAEEFDPNGPAVSKDPATLGWKLIAAVDTRPKSGDGGGQYAVSVFDTGGSLGRFRHLLFDISRTEATDEWGNTFYSEITVIERGVPTTMAALPLPARPDPPGDPMDWKPPQDLPSLHERLSPTVFAERSKAVRAAIDLASLRAPGRPKDGLLIVEVLPASPAAKLGLKVGDIVLALDGVALGSQGPGKDFSALRTDAPQELRFWSATSGMQTVTIAPGRLGVFYAPGWRPLEAYARSSDRNPAWDDDMLVAAATFTTQPDLAETALFYANRAGYVGRFLRPLAARIAFAERRFEDTLALGWPLGPDAQPASDESITIYNSAALLSFKLEQSLQLAKRYPNLLGDAEEIQTAVTRYRAMPKYLASDPLTELNHVTRNRVRKFAAVPATEVNASEWAASSLNHHQSLEIRAPTGRYMSSALTPGFANVSLALRFEAHNSDKEDTPYSRWIVFGLFDTKSPTAAPLNVTLSTVQAQSISPFDMPRVPVLASTYPRLPTHLDGTLRMIILHNRCEIFLDGKRIYYGPALADESDRRYGMYMQACGMDGHVLPPVFEELVDSAAIPRSGARSP